MRAAKRDLTPSPLALGVWEENSCHFTGCQGNPCPSVWGTLFSVTPGGWWEHSEKRARAQGDFPDDRPGGRGRGRGPGRVCARLLRDVQSHVA